MGPTALIPTVRAETPLAAGSAAVDAAFIDLVGQSRLVLLGEATHGTHEFYTHRAHLTRLLITGCGFHAIVVEADWPDAYRVNRYIRGTGRDADALAALGDFERFPRWMWRNRAMLPLIEWLRNHNASQPLARQVGFYGLDLYSLHHSMEAVIRYLERIDPDAAARARRRYACFEDFSDPHAYGQAVSLALTPTCEQAVIAQLTELHRHALLVAGRDGLMAEDESFYAEQNARVVMGAERYYRTLFGGRVSSWNQRDRYMAQTVEDLTAHLQRTRGDAPVRLVIWAHNSHLGDARATELAQQGELNLGQLLRERHGRQVSSIGFTTYAGTVAAAADWGEPVARRTIRPALTGSHEDVLHHLADGDFFLPLRDRTVPPELRQTRLERAIGVVYRPQSERASHYFHADLPRQFDAVFHFDRTSAVEPLETSAAWDTGDLPETYPSAL
jgi:erythromycin esterase-like protein